MNISEKTQAVIEDVKNLLKVNTVGPLPGGQPENSLLFMDFANYKRAVSNIRKVLGKPVVTPRSLTWDYKTGQIILPNDPSSVSEVMIVIHNK